MPDNPPILELVRVSVAESAFSEKACIKMVDWGICPESYWVVGAAPGNGKTSLLNTATGLYKALEGEVLFFGKARSQFSERNLVEERRRIGIVFENGGRLFNHLSVAENLALPLCYHRNWSFAEAEGKVRQILEATGMGAVALETPSRLTRSMRQRVSLGRALMLEPELLLLDNPLLGLDVRESAWWLEMLASLASGSPLLNGQKLTLAITTDDLRPWTDEGHQFALIKNERLEIIGNRQQLAASQEPLIKQLLADELLAE